jgi:hypothetical protein
MSQDATFNRFRESEITSLLLRFWDPVFSRILFAELRVRGGDAWRVLLPCTEHINIYFRRTIHESSYVECAKYNV